MSKPTKPLAPVCPRRGEVWLVNLNPTLGSEIDKQRPVVVINSNGLGKLPIRLVAPITGWKPAFDGNLWHIRLIPDAQNNLSKESAVDTLQLRGIDTLRFQRKLGQLSALQMEEITAAIAAVIEYS